MILLLDHSFRHSNFVLQGGRVSTNASDSAFYIMDQPQIYCSIRGAPILEGPSLWGFYLDPVIMLSNTLVGEKILRNGLPTLFCLPPGIGPSVAWNWMSTGHLRHVTYSIVLPSGAQTAWRRWEECTATRSSLGWDAIIRSPGIRRARWCFVCGNPAKETYPRSWYSSLSPRSLSLHSASRPVHR